MGHIGTILSISITLYAAVAIIFLISENRRPQATLAWMLVFMFLPGIGVLIYILFGRNRKAFAKQSKLLRQDLEGNVKPILSPLLSGQDRGMEVALLERNTRTPASHESDDEGVAPFARGGPVSRSAFYMTVGSTAH